MAEKSFDLIVLGSGPGGYVAAIRAAQLGLKTALVEKDKHLGGTCLNVGCIPSKALLHSTHLYHEAKEHAAGHGMQFTGLKPDVANLMKRKSGVVDQLRSGVAALVKARKIEVVKGHGSLLGQGKVAVGKETLSAKNILIASGSVPVELPFLPFDGKHIISSTEALSLDKVPGKMVVVGAGAIGLEMGSVWSRLGSDVTVVELLPNAAPGCDTDISKAAEKIFKKQGLKFELNAKVTGVKTKGKKRYLTFEKGGKAQELEADVVLVAVGRKPYTEGLGLDKAGVQTDGAGRIITDKNFQTSAAGVYAIGDVIAGPMLAHKAEEEGVAVAEKLAGKAGHVNYDVIPNVFYTEPEIAAVGLSEQQAKEKGIEVRVGRFPYMGNGRALATGNPDGMVKVIACAKTDKLLGVHIVGAQASETIAAAVTHMEYGGSAEDMARTVAAHPTIGETLKEAAMAVEKRSIHSM